MIEPLDNRELRVLKARAQLLKPIMRLGKEGTTPAFIKALDELLAQRELVKVKFDHHREEKNELMPCLADKVAARIILRVGNVVVLFRRKPSGHGEAIPPAI